MAYATATRAIVLFGGENNGIPFNDTWTWDGSTWTEQQALSSPPARGQAVMADDPATGNAVLFSGLNLSGYLDDTWTWG